MSSFLVPLALGNIGRYLNHSCDPNLVMVPVRTSSAVPHLALFAARDIAQVKRSIILVLVSGARAMSSTGRLYFLYFKVGVCLARNTRLLILHFFSYQHKNVIVIVILKKKGVFEKHKFVTI